MKVYADHAATTPMRERAKAAMIECLEGTATPPAYTPPDGWPP